MRSFRGLHVRAAVVVVSMFMARVAHPEDAPVQAESSPGAPSLEEIDQRVRILERQLELEREAAEAKARESPVLTAGKDGISLRSADGAFGVRFRGYLHADGRFFFEDEETYAAGARADGSRWRISPQAHFYRGRFGLLAEYVRSSQDVVLGAVTETLTNDAWQVQLNWVLTGEDAGYRSVDPRHPFDTRAGNWGAVELVARVSSLRVDKDAFPVLADARVSASEALAVGGGVNWYLNRAVKLAVDYEWSEFDDGAADFQDREDEHVVLVRAQIAF